MLSLVFLKTVFVGILFSGLLNISLTPILYKIFYLERFLNFKTFSNILFIGLALLILIIL